MKTVKVENDVEYISANCMHIINGYTIIVAEDDKTAKLIADAIGVKFENLKARIDNLVSRKEIIREIREIYKK